RPRRIEAQAMDLALTLAAQSLPGFVHPKPTRAGLNIKSIRNVLRLWNTRLESWESGRRKCHDEQPLDFDPPSSSTEWSSGGPRFESSRPDMRRGRSSETMNVPFFRPRTSCGAQMAPRSRRGVYQQVVAGQVKADRRLSGAGRARRPFQTD